MCVCIYQIAHNHAIWPCHPSDSMLLLLLLLLFHTFSVLVANPNKLVSTVANPADGLPLALILSSVFVRSVCVCVCVCVCVYLLNCT